MKVYTDLEQSKNLAKILPLESVDMFYRNNGIDVKLMWEHNAPKVESPCWSLAALLCNIPSPVLSENSGSWTVSSLDSKFPISSFGNGENPIDACVDMIIKLHELNLL